MLFQEVVTNYARYWLNILQNFSVNFCWNQYSQILKLETDRAIIRCLESEGNVFRLCLKKRKPASDTPSPFCMLLIGSLIFMASNGDRTVNGLPVSIRASTTPKNVETLRQKKRKGKSSPYRIFCSDREYVSKVVPA